MERYDLAVIGTGPAGISAAITASIRNKKVLLLGSKDLSMKVQKAHTIHNYPGLPAVTGEELVESYQKHLKMQNLEITEDKISTVYAMGDYFAIMGREIQYEASAVILGTGVSSAKMLPGEQEYLGRGVSYCATCDAMLYRGKKVIVVGQTSKEEEEAQFLSEVASEVIYLPQYQEETKLPDQIQVVREKPVKIDRVEAAAGMNDRVEAKEAVGTETATCSLLLETDGGSYQADGIFILRESVAPSQLVPGLEMDGAHILVNRRMETNIPGCFACGDIVGAPYQYIKSAGEGNIAAISAAGFLDKRKREQA